MINSWKDLETAVSRSGRMHVNVSEELMQELVCARQELTMSSSSYDVARHNRMKQIDADCKKRMVIIR